MTACAVWAKTMNELITDFLTRRHKTDDWQCWARCERGTCSSQRTVRVSIAFSYLRDLSNTFFFHRAVTGIVMTPPSARLFMIWPCQCLLARFQLLLSAPESLSLAKMTQFRARCRVAAPAVCVCVPACRAVLSAPVDRYDIECICPLSPLTHSRQLSARL